MNLTMSCPWPGAACCRVRTRARTLGRPIRQHTGSARRVGVGAQAGQPQRTDTRAEITVFGSPGGSIHATTRLTGAIIAQCHKHTPAFSWNITDNFCAWTGMIPAQSTEISRPAARQPGGGRTPQLRPHQIHERKRTFMRSVMELPLAAGAVAASPVSESSGCACAAGEGAEARQGGCGGVLQQAGGDLLDWLPVPDLVG